MRRVKSGSFQDDFIEKKETRCLLLTLCDNVHINHQKTKREIAENTEKSREKGAKEEDRKPRHIFWVKRDLT